MNFNKLVRDRIPQVISAKGQKAAFGRYDDDLEFSQALRNKILEEAQEVWLATPEDLATEISDLLEVIEALQDHFHISKSLIESLKKSRKEERGGFNDRVLLIDTDQT